MLSNPPTLEEWKQLEIYNKYEVSSLGRIRNSVSKIIRIPDINSKGYERLRVIDKGKYIRMFVHRLVALAFLPNLSDKPMVDHIDGNRSNNALSNLRWATRSENMLNTKVRKDKKHTTLRNIIKNGRWYRWKICVEGRIHTSPNFVTEEEAHNNFLLNCNSLTTCLRVLI